LLIACEAWRYRDDERLELLGAGETRIDMLQGDKRTNQQSRHNEQRQRQCDLSNDQGAPRALSRWSITG
jgi:hypothetical protein